MKIKLLGKNTLTFLRDDESNKGYYAVTGNWVASSKITITATGSLQPLKGNIGGLRRSLDEHGYFSTDIQVFYTPTKVRGVDQFGKTGADTTTVDGFTYDAFSVKNWTTAGLGADHYKILLVRQDIGGG